MDISETRGETRRGSTPDHSPAYEAQREAQHAARGGQRLPATASAPSTIIAKVVEGPSNQDLSIEICYTFPADAPFDLSEAAKQSIFTQFLDSVGRTAKGRYQVKASGTGDAWRLEGYHVLEDPKPQVILESVEGPGDEGLSTTIFYPRTRGETWELNAEQQANIFAQFTDKTGRGTRGHYHIHVARVGSQWQISSINRA